MTSGRSCRWIVLALAALAFSAARVSSADIIVGTDIRSVSIPSLTNDTVPTVPGTTVFNPLIYDGGYQASQESVLGTQEFGGRGNVNSRLDAPPGNVHSVFDVTFQVSQSSWFFLTGGTSLDVHQSGTPAVDPLVAFFSSSLGDTHSLVTGSTGGAFYLSGLLTPGVDYRLFFSTSEVPIGSGDSAGWNFQLSAPEPELWLLLLTGLVFLLRARI